jgi:hypothetical protein
VSVFIGIDPGVAGGLASITEAGVVFSVPMPKTEADLLQVLRDMQAAPLSDRVHAVLERVSSSPQMGVSSAFTFGKGYGGLRMALIATGIPFDEAVARRWQPVVGVVYPKGTPYGERKRLSRQRAQELFPGLEITPAVADAILIAEYARRCAMNPVAAVKKRGSRPKPLLDAVGF